MNVFKIASDTQSDTICAKLHVKYLRCERSTILCRYTGLGSKGTVARAPRGNIALINPDSSCNNYYCRTSGPTEHNREIKSRVYGKRQIQVENFSE